MLEPETHLRLEHLLLSVLVVVMVVVVKVLVVVVVMVVALYLRNLHIVGHSPDGIDVEKGGSHHQDEQSSSQEML